jgi:hypothetical protein
MNDMKKFRDELAKHLCDEWEEDGSTPPNLVRRNGLGKVVAKVDRWCGGYQSPYKPEVIGWTAKCNTGIESGMIHVRIPLTSADIALAISEAQSQADEALKNFGWPSMSKLQEDDALLKGEVERLRKENEQLHDMIVTNNELRTEILTAIEQLKTRLLRGS